MKRKANTQFFLISLSLSLCFTLFGIYTSYTGVSARSLMKKKKEE
jgi:hypothetical protein